MIRSFNGKKPKIATTAFVSEAAYIIGDVEIGEGSSVWPGAVIRGDLASIKIGSNTHIEDNCVVHTGIIGNNVQIGHGAVIHCSKIGNNVLIGMNATILDGVEIGDFCIIGANSLISEGMNIPDRTFITGVTTEIKGEISAAQIARLERGVNTYFKLSREYKQQGL